MRYNGCDVKNTKNQAVDSSRKEDITMENRQKLVVFSADAMVFEDMELMRTLPNFSRYFANASGVKRVRSIYPSVTYPAHATIASGLYPCHHGIVNNEVLCPGRTPRPGTGFTMR